MSPPIVPVISVSQFEVTKARHEDNAFWFFVADTLLFAAGLLIYFKRDESSKGPWYPRGVLLEVAIFLLILFT